MLHTTKESQAFQFFVDTVNTWISHKHYARWELFKIAKEAAQFGLHHLSCKIFDFLAAAVRTQKTQNNLQGCG